MKDVLAWKSKIYVLKSRLTNVVVSILTILDTNFIQNISVLYFLCTLKNWDKFQTCEYVCMYHWPWHNKYMFLLKCTSTTFRVGSRSSAFYGYREYCPQVKSKCTTNPNL